MPTWPPLLQIWRTVGHDQHGRTDAAVPFLGLPNIRSFHCCIAWLQQDPLRDYGVPQFCMLTNAISVLEKG